jgi:hypothetical protein
MLNLFKMEPKAYSLKKQNQKPNTDDMWVEADSKIRVNPINTEEAFPRQSPQN